MATNVIFEDANTLDVICTHPSSPTSGSPVRVGDICGLALTDKRTTSNKTSVKFNGVVAVSVKGIDGSGNSAVAVGDSIYYVDADTPVLSKKTAGKLYGFALEAVTSGSTATIRVKLAN